MFFSQSDLANSEIIKSVGEGRSFGFKWLHKETAINKYIYNFDTVRSVHKY